MIKWFYKYGFVVLLLNTILYSIPETMHIIAPVIFYSLMFFSGVFLLINPQQIREVLLHKSFLFLLLINVLNLIYFLFFDDIDNQKSLEYLLARFAQFSLISFSVYYNYDYFKSKFPTLLIISVSIVIVLGLFISPPLFADRYSGIVWNPNQLSSISLVAFSFLFLREKNKSRLEILLLLILFVIIMSTGSRLSILALSLSFLFKFGLSIRNLIYAFMGFLLMIGLSFTQLNTSMNRISSQSIFSDRAIQFDFAIDNLNNKLFSGNGLSEYSGFPESIIINEEYEGLFMASHNGYLAILIQYGLLFGAIFLLILLKKSVSLVLYFNTVNHSSQIYIFIVVFTLLAANFESLITGINEFMTVLFWFSLSYLSYSKFIKKHES